jgi:hypothetical protein
VFVGGRVFVFGGLSGASTLRTTEVLYTQTGLFTAGPNMLTGRQRCAAVLMDAGRVLLVGGYNGAPLNTTEILHLSSNTFAPGPDLAFSRVGCAAVLLDAGRILVVGGHRNMSGDSGLSTTEIFSLDTMAFAPGPTMAVPRYGCAAIALDEHRVLVAGGDSSSGCLATTEVLDVRTMAFAPGPSMGSARGFCAAVRVDAQHVLVIGGQDSATTPLATTELLDVAMMEFSPGLTMPSVRPGAAAVRLDAAEEAPRILVLGGGVSTTALLAVRAETGARRRQ